MSRFKDITGQRFGRLVALHHLGSVGRDERAQWFCKCDCGNETAVTGKFLRNGDTKSCGCLHTPHGHARKDKLTPEFWTWTAMMKRCFYPNAIDYDRYGGRGITVCKRWREFRNFLADMGPRPKGHTIDRIDNNGSYQPDNCRWATASLQALNRPQRQRGHRGRYV